MVAGVLRLLSVEGEVKRARLSKVNGGGTELRFVPRTILAKGKTHAE